MVFGHKAKREGNKHFDSRTTSEDFLIGPIREGRAREGLASSEGERPGDGNRDREEKLTTDESSEPSSDCHDESNKEERVSHPNRTNHQEKKRQRVSTSDRGTRTKERDRED